MIDLLEMCLKQYDYVLVDSVRFDDVKFYKKADTEVANYFLIHSIDCTSFETDEKTMKTSLAKLEADYVGNNGDSYNVEASIKQAIINAFDSIREASQIDKNTSAIYLLKFNDIRNFKKHRNSVYAIEESPNYFLRYVLPYTQEQVDSLRKALVDSERQKVNETLSDIANDEREYYKLMEDKNSGSDYELAIRMFSKVPFLQYSFPAAVTPRSIEEDALDVIRDKGLGEYHNAIKTGVDNLDALLKLEPSITNDDKEIENEINRLLGGSESGV